jgi:DNA-binding beta-propeller fold protein YncE
MPLKRTLLAGLVTVWGCAASGAPSSTASPAPTSADQTDTAHAPALDYLVYVVSESSDEVSLIRFGPGGARVERSFRTGLIPTEINGPHGVAVAPDGLHYFVSVGHGTPFGTLWKYTTAVDQLVDRTMLGNFPASLQVSPDGAWVFVANFNLHGDMVPSSISVVDATAMVEVARITTCTMPHGSRFNPAGTRHYSTCMMDDALVEIDTRTFSVARHFVMSKGRESGRMGAPSAAMHAGMSGAPPAGGQPMQHAMMHDPTCSPTWAESSRDGKRVFVACNKSDEIVVIDAGDWTLERRVPAAPGPYNLAPSPDGRLLLATNKRDQSVSVYEIATWRELARIRTARPIVHGVVVSPDSRYAFVSVEGIGAEPGTVEIIDLAALRSVARVEVGQQAAGLDFWKTEPTVAR